jgi:hypothetical protein
MVAFGCLLLLILPLIGLAIGGYIGGFDVALWTALAGFVVAGAACGITAAALVKAGRR